MRIVDAWHNKDRTRTARYGTGKRWIATWREDPAKPQRKKSFEKRAAAEAFLTKVERDQHAGYMQVAEPKLFDEWLTSWRSRQLHQEPGAQRVIDVVAKRLIGAFGGRYMQDIARPDIQQAVSDWEGGGLAPATVQVTMAYLTSVFRDAAEDKVIRETPVRRISRRKVEAEPIVPLSVTDVQTIIDAMTVDFARLAVFAASTGLRQGELAGLTVDRVQLQRQSILVDRQWQGGVSTGEYVKPKTARSVRRLSIGTATTQLLRPLVEGRGGAEPVFTGGNGGRMTGRRQAEEWRRVRGLLPDINMGRGWHQLRHHHASQLIAEGASPVAVAARLGHKDVSLTLKVYAHLWESDDAKLAGLSDGLVNVGHHHVTTNGTSAA